MRLPFPRRFWDRAIWRRWHGRFRTSDLKACFSFPGLSVLPRSRMARAGGWYVIENNQNSIFDKAVNGAGGRLGPGATIAYKRLIGGIPIYMPRTRARIGENAVVNNRA